MFCSGCNSYLSFASNSYVREYDKWTVFCKNCEAETVIELIKTISLLEKFVLDNYDAIIEFSTRPKYVLLRLYGNRYFMFRDEDNLHNDTIQHVHALWTNAG